MGAYGPVLIAKFCSPPPVRLLVAGHKNDGLLFCSRVLDNLEPDPSVSAMGVDSSFAGTQVYRCLPRMETKHGGKSLLNTLVHFLIQGVVIRRVVRGLAEGPKRSSSPGRIGSS